MPHRIFTPLGTAARRDYAQVLLHLYREGLASDVFGGLDLRRGDMVGLLAGALAARRPSAFTPDAHNTTISDDPHLVYRNLIDAGWFAERTVGSETLVVVSRQVMELLDALDRIDRGASVNFTGSLQTMETALKALREDPAGRAMMLAVAAQQAEDFARRMLAVASDIRANEARIAGRSGFGEMMAAFFDEFVTHLVSDYRAMKSRYNPLRHAVSIVSTAALYADDDAFVARLAEGYVACGQSEDAAAAAVAVRAHLDTVQGVLSRAQTVVDDIDAVRLRVEERIARAVRFMDAASAARTKEIEEVSRLLGHLPAEIAGADLPASMLLLDDFPIGPRSMASPRRRLAAVGPVGVAAVEHDPELAALARERVRYAEDMIPTARSIEEYVERHLGVAASMPLSGFTVEAPREMLLLAAVRSAAANTDAAVRDRYGVTFEGGMVDGVWSEYAAGTLYRKGSSADPATEAAESATGDATHAERQGEMA